jgi:hypothetical protein
MRTIAQYRGWRITEELDPHWSFSSLEGDAFDPEVNTEMRFEDLKRQQQRFRTQVNSDGVWGYTLQKWNPAVGKGWEFVDSCWGFVGRYNSETNPHHVVSEYMERIYSGLDLEENAPF